MAQSHIPVSLHPDMGERLDCDFLIFRSRTLEQAQCPITAHHHRFKNCDWKVAVDYTLLRQVTDLRPMVTAQFIAGTIENMEMALDGSHESQYSFTESGFPRSVRTDDADEFTCIDG